MFLHHNLNNWNLDIPFDPDDDDGLLPHNGQQLNSPEKGSGLVFMHIPLPPPLYRSKECNPCLRHDQRYATKDTQPKYVRNKWRYTTGTQCTAVCRTFTLIGIVLAPKAMFTNYSKVPRKKLKLHEVVVHKNVFRKCVTHVRCSVDISQSGTMG